MCVNQFPILEFKNTNLFKLQNDFSAIYRIKPNNDSQFSRISTNMVQQGTAC